MKKIKNFPVFVLLIALFVFVPILTFAHQPRITTQKETIVTDPEISKAYYAELQGEPQVYDIKSDKPFNFYIELTVPDIKDQRTDFSYYVFKNGNFNQPFTEFYGGAFEWSKFWEKFGRDSYLQSASYQNEVEAGEYQIKILNSDNKGKYVLAIGEKEAFDFKETVNAINLIPKIKRDFFNESPMNFILSPFGWGYVLIVYLMAFVLGFLYRFIMKKLAKNSVRGVAKNINKKDRWFRALVGLGLFFLVITTTWNPIILFFSGFCFFEAIFSWCGLYAALGKNTCPIE